MHNQYTMSSVSVAAYVLLYAQRKLQFKGDDNMDYNTMMSYAVELYDNIERIYYGEKRPEPIDANTAIHRVCSNNTNRLHQRLAVELNKCANNSTRARVMQSFLITVDFVMRKRVDPDRIHASIFKACYSFACYLSEVALLDGKQQSCSSCCISVCWYLFVDIFCYHINEGKQLDPVNASSISKYIREQLIDCFSVPETIYKMALIAAKILIEYYDKQKTKEHNLCNNIILNTQPKYKQPIKITCPLMKNVGKKNTHKCMFYEDECLIDKDMVSKDDWTEHYAGPKKKIKGKIAMMVVLHKAYFYMSQTLHRYCGAVESEYSAYCKSILESITSPSVLKLASPPLSPVPRVLSGAGFASTSQLLPPTPKIPSLHIAGNNKLSTIQFLPHPSRAPPGSARGPIDEELFKNKRVMRMSSMTASALSAVKRPSMKIESSDHIADVEQQSVGASSPISPRRDLTNTSLGLIVVRPLDKKGKQRKKSRSKKGNSSIHKREKH